jgi:hypothetical protein
MKMHVRMPRRLQIRLRFVRGQVVEDQLWISLSLMLLHQRFMKSRHLQPPSTFCGAALADVTFSYSTRSAAC